VLIWLIPGSFVFIRQALRDYRPPRSIDSTVYSDGEFGADTHDHVVTSHHVSDLVETSGGEGGGAD
jgi:hypothetical protein